MKLPKLHGLALFIALYSVFARGQAGSNPVVTNPTATQQIVQPAGTSFNVIGTMGVGQGTNGTAAIDAHDGFAFFGNNNPMNSIAINSAGPVGIGTGLSGASNWLSIAGGMNVDANDDATDVNWINSNTNTGISFGMFSGEGLGSARVDGSLNQNGLDLYTAYAKRLSITQAGSIGVGTVTPNIWSAVNTGTVGTNLQIFGSSVSRLILNSPAQSELHMVNGSAAPNQRNHRLYTGSNGLILDQPADDYSSNTLNMSWLNNGFVGIGTITPSSTLEVNGGITLTRGSRGALTFADGTIQNTALPMLSTGGGGSASNYLQINANNGTPSYLGNVVNGQNDWSLNTYYNGSSWIYGATGPTAAIRMGTNVGMMSFYTTEAGAGGSVNSTMDTAGPKMSLSLTGGLSLGNQYVTTDPGAGSLIVAGNVGIGTPTPASTLEVDGTVTIGNPSTGAIAGGLVFAGFPNSPQTQPWTGHVGGQDYADLVNVSGSPFSFEAGDVLVIDPHSARKFLKSGTPYSTLVSGVYSTKPGVLGTQHIHSASMPDEIPMALVGIVPTKVSAENGPIKIGDLLVTSSTPGHAMKGTDRTQLAGALVGKALGNLVSGTGVIDVLIALQ